MLIFFAQNNISPRYSNEEFTQLYLDMHSFFVGFEVERGAKFMQNGKFTHA